MSATRNTVASIVAFVFCTLWVWVLWSERFVGVAWISFAVIAAFFLVSCYALHRQVSRGLTLNSAAVVACGFTAALLMFTLWPTFIAVLTLPSLAPTLPSSIRLSALFFPGAASAAVMALLFAFPLALLLPRYYWSVPASAAAIVLAVQYGEIFNPSQNPSAFVRGVMLYEIVCLLALVPLLLKFLIPKVRILFNKAG